MKMTRRDIKTAGETIGRRSTGEEWRTPSGKAVRYETAPTPEGQHQAYWFLAERGGWHAFTLLDPRIRPLNAAARATRKAAQNG